ncbi:capsular polysaccharide export protein [Allofrancisella inopinata]|uniref:Capsular biosynthesis protein n=1 Tax=Allofrancisella inopinata TaxID=1085647 RepID=A0AAE7CR60_9GAMM|nr:capsular biosynthesis protein [Allofrancisella inopinata]QIV96512.1 capsular biosynthesis protein [Allofrancisella inopinata]TDT68493.1 capsular polysaccharide export protein [Allofrancisella inopinata]
MQKTLNRPASFENKKLTVIPYERNFLFLQGPISPFFNELAHELCQKGYSKVYKLQLCKGDSLWWDFELITYKGTLENFDIFIEATFKNLYITDILLLGDCRPYHLKATKIAKSLNINIWIFEEGYLRPDTVTLEYNSGTNAYSKIPKTKDFFQTYKPVKNYPLIRIQNSLFTRLRWDLSYHLINALTFLSFRNYQHHRKAKIYQEYIGWMKRFSKKIITDKFLLPKQLKYVENKAFFLVPLQLSHDFQIIQHSDYDSTLCMIDEILESFERNAPKETLLVFKIHPLDTLLVNSIKHIKRKLKTLPSLKKRVLVLDGGHLPTLIDNSLGVVVINSTVGLQSLSHDKATKALGRAIYNFEGLTATQPLNTFWINPQKPNKQLVQNFRKYLLDHNQFNGGFYSKHGISIAVPFVTHRILENN